MSLLNKDSWKDINVNVGEVLRFTYSGLQENPLNIPYIGDFLGFSKDEVINEITSNIQKNYVNVFALQKIETSDITGGKYNLYVTVKVVGSPNMESLHKASVVPVIGLFWIITALVGGTVIGLYVSAKLDKIENITSSFTEIGTDKTTGKFSFGGLIPIALLLLAGGYIISKITVLKQV